MNLKQKIIFISVGLIFLFFLIIFIFSTRAPYNFPNGLVYTLDKGVGLNSLADDLTKKDIIRSPFVFKVFSVLFGGPKGIMAGDYQLESSQNVITLARRISEGDYRLQKIKITIPEGFNVFEIAKLLSLKFPKVQGNDFVERAKNLEGYLFPDTYIFEINTEPAIILKTMNDNFRKKILEIDESFKQTDKKESDIIKMASILEEEARTTESRKIIADILWRRLSLNMPLQVDASFKYINGKGSKDLTLADLKIDSPYNSYLYKGLPPTPISNPGLDSIMSAINPTKNPYLYFLTDKNGEMHYAKTYSEHLLNKEKYLK